MSRKKEERRKKKEEEDLEFALIDRRGTTVKIKFFANLPECMADGANKCKPAKIAEARQNLKKPAKLLAKPL